MSVINKMLRDLDSRQLEGTLAVPGQGPVAGMMRGTFSVDPLSGRPQGGGRRLVLWLLLAVAILAVAGAMAWWLWWRPVEVKPMAVPVAVAVVSVPAPMPITSAPALAVSAAASAPAAGVSAAPDSAAAALAPLAAASMPAALASLLPVVPAPPAPEPVALAAALKASAVAATTPPRPPQAGASQPLRVPVSGPVAAAPLPAAALPVSAPSSQAKVAAPQPLTAARPAPPKPESAQPPAAAPTPQRGSQAAAMETLAQAQGLWNAGSREAAMETLREAVTTAERANLAASPGGMASFVMLVRELCRMQLAEGQVSQVMALLTRLEPQLADQADIWALRGNAAQRLGRHQDSAGAYLAALKLRPGEARWMLGAAVSLAALGQTAAAAEWAEKARAAGVASPEVLNYLRQMGVPLRDR